MTVPEIAPAPAAESLYDQIGGADGVASLVDQFYQRVHADPALAPFFHGVSADALQRMQSEFFAAALGGPVLYTGRPLIHAHHHLKITLADYQRFVQHLFETLTAFRLTDRESYEVIGRLNLYTNDVVSAGTGLVG